MNTYAGGFGGALPMPGTLPLTGQVRKHQLARFGVRTWPRSAACHPEWVSAAELHAAVAEYRAAQLDLDRAKASVTHGQARLKEAREDLERAIVDMAIDGTRMKDLVDETGLSREWIRTLLRKNGVQSDRD